jgi:hypothetical protein
MRVHSNSACFLFPSISRNKGSISNSVFSVSEHLLRSDFNVSMVYPIFSVRLRILANVVCISRTLLCHEAISRSKDEMVPVSNLMFGTRDCFVAEQCERNAHHVGKYSKPNREDGVHHRNVEIWPQQVFANAEYWVRYRAFVAGNGGKEKASRIGMHSHLLAA